MYLGSPDEMQFSLLVDFAGFFLAACIAHGLFCEHGPYGIDWISTTFLSTTTLALATAFLGVNPCRGLLLTGIAVRSMLNASPSTRIQLWSPANRNGWRSTGEVPTTIRR